MTSRCRSPFSTHTIGLGDLDLQPVREAKVRVLNDIPKEPVVPPPAPQVKLNFIDVTFPRPPQEGLADSAHSHHGNASRSPKKRSNVGKEVNARDQVRYNKVNSYAGQAQRNMERDRREYLSQLLKRGIPVWEEVPEEERASRVIGGTNPFRHHPYSSNPMMSDITHKSANKQKSSKIIQAVWEDVQDGSKYSYPLEHSNVLIGSPRESVSEGEEIDLKSRAEKLNKTLQKKSQTSQNLAYDTPFYKQSQTTSGYEHYLGGHTMPLENHGRTHEPCISPATFSKELNRGEISQAHPTSQDQDCDIEEYNSKGQETPHKNPPENLVFQEIPSPVHGGSSPLEDRKPQDGDVFVSVPVMKKIYIDQTDNNATSSLSWWPGDKLYKERSKNEEEEKHEKESTKEKKGKRDLSTPPSNPQKRRHVVADEGKAETMKPPPRVRHYEPDEVRRYMREKQCERAKATKEQQRRQEQERIQKSERMKELATKTKELSHASKKVWQNPMPAGFVNQEQNQLEQQPIIAWSSHKDWRPENYSEALPLHKTSSQLKEQNLLDAAPFVPYCGREDKSFKQNETKKEANQVAMVPPCPALDEEDKYGEADSNKAKKRNKKDGKRRKKRQSMSDSEAINDIVSRTVEECERQVKSSSVSMESLSSLSSYSCSSSDAESRSSQSESLSCSLDLTPKERVVALGQLAQKLTNKVTQKAGTLSQWEKHNQEVPDVPQETASVNIRKQVTRKLPAKNITIMNDPRASLSLSQIETMSVEELIAKMTAMLPNKSVNESRSNAPETDLQRQNINANEKQNFKNNKVQTRIESMTNRHTRNNPVRESLQRALTDQLPKLVVPDVPKLKLSGGNEKFEEPQKIVQQQNLSMLPECHAEQSMKDLKSQTDEEKKTDVKMIPTHNLQDRYVLPQRDRLVTGRQQDQPQLFTSTYRNCPISTRKKFEQAALVIQSAYRGYRVRKVTNSLISRHTVCRAKCINKTNSFRRVPSNTQVSVGPGFNKFYKKSASASDGSDVVSQQVLKEGREEIIWREIRSELESRALKPHRESYYVSQRSDLPGWIKPYFVLSETGDVNNFLETHVNEPGDVDERDENRSNYRMTNQGQDNTQNHPQSVFKESVHDVTLTEGPLLDIGKGTVYGLDKETQASYNKCLNIKGDKEGADQNSNAAQVSSEVQKFIDLKELSKRKVISQSGESAGSIQKAESFETLSSGALAASQSALSQEDHEDTLEEGPLEEALGGGNSFQATANETLESGSIQPNFITEEGPHTDTSGVMDSSNSSSSVIVEEASAPHELLGEGVHLGPASLRLRLNAELMYQDTLGKALNQLHNVEQLNILNRSRQEAVALSQSLALQQQKVELAAQWKNGNELNIQEKEAKRRDDYEKRLKEKLKQQETALQKVEKIEKEARSRFAELEREVRSRAEQVIAQARVPQPSSAHSDVIAAAAVAAVGATISQWKQLRRVRSHDSHGTIMQSDGPLSPESCSEQNVASSSTPLSDKSYSGPYSGKSLSKENKSSGDKMASLISEVLDENLLETSIIEEVVSGNSTNKNSEGSQVSSDINSSQNSIPENIVNVKSSTPFVNQSTGASESFVKSNDCFNQFNGKLMAQDAGKLLLQESKDSGSVSEKIDCASGAETGVISGEVMSSSNMVSEDISSSKYSGKWTTAISKNVASIATKSNEVEVVPSVESSQTLKGSSITDHKKYQLNELLPSKTNNGSSLMSSSSESRERERKKGENDTSDNYSGSYEVESETEGSNTSQLQGQGQGGNGGDLALVVSSNNIMNELGYRSFPQGAGGVTAPVPGGGGDGALGVTLSVVESLLKEEEVHYQHQKSLLKLQEQSLVEEAKWKLATLQSEGGPGMRRRQRAIVLQLREQKAYLKRLRETQNIGAQQRRLMLLQVHHLLATTKNLSGFSSKGYLAATRGHSPNPSSPRLTPRLMEMLSSSSSDTPDDATLGLLMRGRDTDSSSPSESGGGREKRRSHSEDRLKSSSSRLHEKRRAVEIENLQQQILHEDKEILRLKVKSAYDIYDKDSVKPKRKGDFIAKRIREKKDRNSGSVSPLSALVQGSRTSAESSLPTENMVATAHDSQSSVPEEGGSEIVSQSDVASSVSEQEGLTSSSHRKGNSQSKEVSGSRRVPSCGISEMETKDSFFSKPRMSSELESDAIQEQHSEKDSKVLEKSSSVKTVSSEETSFSIEERLSHEKSEGSSKSLEKSKAVESEVYERNSKSQETSVRSKLGSSGSAKSGWSKSEHSIPEDVADNSGVRSVSNSSWCSSETRVDCGARSSDSKLAGGKVFSQKSSNKGLPLPLKVPLSPRSLCRQHRRYSSESDDSFTLSQTETASDVSDGEGKLLALKEELAVRRAEAERLKKEKRKLRRERLASQERALRQQISTYDAYIQHARMELEKESKELQQASMVRPLIKKPQVAETKKSRLSEPLVSPEKSDVSDASLVSEGSKSDQSNITRSQEISSNDTHHIKSYENAKPQELHLTQMGAVPLKNQEIILPSSSKEANAEEKSSRKVTASETVTSHRENESQETSCSSSVSETLNEESISKETQNDDSKKSPSQESSFESEHTQSRGSSTETIVHSPQKPEPSPRDEIAVSISEVNAALLEVLKNNEKDDHANSRAGGSETRIKVEGEKLEIFIPTSSFKYSEAEELVEGNTNTSAEQSICEEVFDDNFEETENESSSQEMEVSENVFHQMTKESKMYENTDTGSSSLSENKEPSSKTKLFAETDTPNCALQAKDILFGSKATKAPTLDRQRLVDDISNNLLAIMMKDTSQLFTTIMKDKVVNSKVSEVEDAAEAVSGSTATELIGETSEFQKDAGTQSQHSCPIIPEEDGSSPKQNSSSKSQILQRVNELIGEGGSMSQHLLTSSSTKSADVQLTSHLTFDLSPESTSPISPTSAKASKVEKDGLMGLFEGASPRLLGKETVSPAAAPSESHQEEKEHDSLSPSHDVVKAGEYKLDTDTLTTRLLNLASAPELDLEARFGQLGESTEFSVEGIEGDWFDDDFWTSSDSKRKQQQLKAEEERITAEIARLEELQHLQQQYPGLVIREVPNKPPPPYTPPQVTSAPSPGSSPTPDRPPAYTSPPTSPILPEAQPLSPSHSSSISHRLSKADQRKLAAHITQVVPITEEEALPIIDRALDTLCEAWENNIDPEDIPPPPHTNLAKDFSLSSFIEEDMHEDEKTSNRAFHLLLFCLAQELLCVPYKLQHSAQRPPWIKHMLPQARMVGIVKTKSSAGLFSYVHEQVKILFGWKPPLQKESLMIRWAQKHRDLVDQVLVKELQAEEASWTNYDEDEAAVKTKVASEILDTLLSETVALVSDILVRKLQYIVH